jgi:hypothetical protein
MSTITTIQASDLITNSRADINNNFSALNTDKIETSTLDTDTSLTANSDSKIATQKAVKEYADSVVTGIAGQITNVQNFETTGTWTKPTGAKVVEVICIGGGGGGSRDADANSQRGWGGGGGGLSRRTFPASILGTTETVTVGAAGTGAVVANTAGVDGGDTTFGAWLKAGGGKKGTTSESGAGGNGEGVGSLKNVIAVLGGAGGGDSMSGSPFGAGGGGQGSTPGVAGKNGGSQAYRGTTLVGGVGGAGAGGNGDPCTQYEAIPGTGGAGGGGVTGGVGGAGGNGGRYGGGGGGGGGSSSTTSGNGGNGAIGFCQVITYF